MVAAISLILLICFSSFRRLSLSGKQGQFSCEPHGYDADRGENINELVIRSAALGFHLGIVHFEHLRSESCLLIAFTTHWNEKAHLDEKQKNFFGKISDHRIRAVGDLT